MRLALLISILPALAAAAIAQTTATAPSASAPPATATASSRPTTNPAEEALDKIKAILSVPRPQNAEEYRDAMNQRVPEVLAAIDEMARRFGQAPELADARMIGIVSATQLGRAANDPAMIAKALSLARDVLASGASEETKLYADAHLLLLAIRPLGSTPTQPAPDAEKRILDYAAKYAKTALAPQALDVGMQMANLVEKPELVERLGQTLAKDYPDSPLARQMLRRQGRSPDVGKPFVAELTGLDGAKLSLPENLPGKTVVVVFWATWNGPSLTRLPELKELHAKYTDKGVQFVGISLDTDRRRLSEFVKALDLPWVQTFSGKGLDDPTAKRYAIALPSIWLIGRDGKVISDHAVADLGELLEKALGQATSAPASGPAATGATAPE